MVYFFGLGVCGVVGFLTCFVTVIVASLAKLGLKETAVWALWIMIGYCILSAFCACWLQVHKGCLAARRDGVPLCTYFCGCPSRY